MMLATQRVLHAIVWTLWATHTRKLQGEERMLALGGAVMRESAAHDHVDSLGYSHEEAPR